MAQATDSDGTISPINKRALKKIIFGCKADATSIALVTKWTNMPTVWNILK